MEGATTTAAIILPTQAADKNTEYWIPVAPLDERRLILVLAKMIKHYLDTHSEKFAGEGPGGNAKLITTDGEPEPGKPGDQNETTKRHELELRPARPGRKLT